jgi:hypothetical protein
LARLSAATPDHTQPTNLYRSSVAVVAPPGADYVESSASFPTGGTGTC